MSHRVLYLTSIVVLVVMAAVALLSFRSARQTAEANEKADQLIAEITAAGLRAPQQEQIVSVLGEDGGSVCNQPEDALRQSILHGQLTNGAAGPGQRPVIADNKALQGQLLIIKVYCPQYLEPIQNMVNDLNLAEVA